jgi:transposase
VDGSDGGHVPCSAALGISENPGPRSALAEEAEIRELRKRNRLLEQENEVLRRAAIYLGQGLNPK